MLLNYEFKRLTSSEHKCMIRLYVYVLYSMALTKLAKKLSLEAKTNN